MSLTIARAVGFIFILMIVVAPTTIVLIPLQEGWEAGIYSHKFVKARAVQILAALLLLYFASSRNVTDLIYCKHPLLIGLVLFIAWATLSILWSWNRDYTIVYLMNLYGAALLGFLVLQVRSRSHLITLLGYLYFGCVLLATFGLLQHFFQIEIVPQARAPASTFANKNMAAQVVVATWLLGIFFLSRTGARGNYQFALCTSIALVLAYIFHTQTRAAWVAMSAQLIALSLFILVSVLRSGQALGLEKVGWKPILVSLFIFLFLVNADSSGYKPAWESAAGQLSDIVTVSNSLGSDKEYSRFALWRATFEIIMDQPVLGVGLGGFEYAYQMYSNSKSFGFLSAHNDLLQIASELGIVGALLALGCVAIMLALGYKYLVGMHSGDTFLKYLILILIGGLAVNSMFSFPLTLIGPLCCVTILLGILLRLEYIKPEQVGYWPLGKKNKRILTGAAALLLSSYLTMNTLWSIDLFNLERGIGKSDLSEEMAFHSPVEHPRYREIIRSTIGFFKLLEPARAEYLARSYYTIGPTDTVVGLAMILALITMKKFDQAQIAIAETRTMEPAGFYRTFEYELIMFERMGNRDKVRQIIREMESFAPDLLFERPETVQNMANASYNIGDREYSASLYKKNIEHFPTYPDSNLTLVKIYLRHDFDELAWEVFEKFVASGGSKGVANTMLSDFSAKAELKAKASLQQ